MALETELEVGRVLTPIVVENLKDLIAAEEGRLPPEQVRHLEVADALVDPGATFLSLPPSAIRQLGLRQFTSGTATTTAGKVTVPIYEAVRLTIQGRSCTVDVAELPAGSPILVGQIPLEILDLVPIPREGKLVPNPAHGGEWIIEMYVCNA